MAAIRIQQRVLSSSAAWPPCETDRESGLLPVNSYLLDRARVRVQWDTIPRLDIDFSRD